MHVAIASFLCLMMMSACNSGSATLQNAIVTTAVDENMRPVDPATIFSPTIQEIFCSVRIKDAPDNTEIRAEWKYIKGESKEQNYIIDSTVLTTEGSRYLSFSLQRGEKSWPVGEYVVVLYVNDVENLSVDFRVESTAKLTDAVMALSVDPVLFTPVEVRSVFDAATPKIYCYVKLTDAPANTEVRADWVSVIDEAKKELSQPFASKNVVTEGGLRHIAFSFTKPDEGWKAGKYVVILYLNGAMKIAMPFDIR